MSAWSHLPNAAHIDAVLAGVRARPEAWGAAQPAWSPVARYEAWDAACYTPHRVTWGVVGDAVWPEIQGISLSAARDTAWDAICTLTAWPESAAMLDLTPDALRTIIDVADGDVKHQAVLLLPAVIARGVK